MSVSDSIALVGAALTGVYVGLTLWLVIITRRSLALARDQVRKAELQSQKSLKLSKQQSGNAIKAVRDQIKASEDQSKKAIEAINKQIKASEDQSTDALHNQHKPVIVPLNFPEQVDDPSVGWNYILDIQNKGTGAALNAWGILITCKPGLTALGQTSPYDIYTLDHLYYLIPDRDQRLGFIDDYGCMSSGLGEVFENHPIYPTRDASGEHVNYRILITYNDIFDNTYLAIFDQIKNFGWEWKLLEKVNKRLDKLVNDVEDGY